MTTNSLTIALLQMTAHGVDQAANCRKGEAFCRRAAALGADVALFPEMWNIGYSFFDRADPRAEAAWQESAIDADDPFVHHFRALSAELDMAIALTYLERWPGKPRNSVALIDRHGEIVLIYAKVHTCAFAAEAALTPGDDFPVAKLDTRAGEVNIGAMICYDREFPESARILMLRGAEIILTPNACWLDANRLTQFRARAFENMTGVAMANYAAPQLNGRSVAYSGIAHAADGTSLETLVVEAGGAEEIYLATFDLDALRAYRQREPWGTAFRRPKAYELLMSEEAMRSQLVGMGSVWVGENYRGR